ncbi:MAG: mechanosensitive ion channel [Flavobacteriaceae bacterium]|nr:mechanosensitive ion channel [Flavobacteriaceae bacterium]MCY4267323.1 mechanosensitive ion channel [Flavobacteriaceae bacterium]MCY4297788.1 mechanosensitive ion channel [Flavobacteriaceae bacterium]
MEQINELFNSILISGENYVITPKIILLSVGSLFVTYFLLRFFRHIIYRTLSRDAREKFRSVFAFVNYFVYVVVILIIFSNIGINVTALFAASAALLVGIGFALQTFFQDIISGIFILSDQAVHVGDVIEVEGKVGRVMNIRLRTTRAMTRQNKILVIPNHKFMSTILYNYTENESMTREVVEVGVSYDSIPYKVKEILLDIAKNHHAVLETPNPLVLFDDFGDSALIFKLIFAVKDSFFSHIVQSDIRYLIYEKFSLEGINIPFPQRTLHFPEQLNILDKTK